MLPNLPPIWLEVELFVIISSAASLTGLLIGLLIKANILHTSRWTSVLSD